MKELTPEERRQIRIETQETIKKLKKKFSGFSVNSSGYGRFIIGKRFQANVEGVITKLYRYKMVDEKGRQYGNVYDGISTVVLNVAVVMTRKNIKFIETNTGLKADDVVKEGLIDIDGKEILPCEYESINVYLDNYVKITKNGKSVSCNLNEIKDGTFDWDEAISWPYKKGEM